MEHLALEVFDLATKETPNPASSQYAVLAPDTTITITDTSEIFADGDVWSYDFKLNVHANAHLFSTAGDIHGSRLHDQIHKRRARLWVEGLPLFLGYLLLDDEVEVGSDGDVDVKFESGQKTFEQLIEGTNAREVSVGDVEIGVALNRKRVVAHSDIGCSFTMDGLAAYAAKGLIPNYIVTDAQRFQINTARAVTPYVQQWPKFVKSHGVVFDSEGRTKQIDYTNIQTPYDGTPEHSFCNINICYPLKANKDGEEVSGRGYTVRLARGNNTTDGGDGQTRYNNAPNFYLLYFIERLFKDLKIHIAENQARDVEDLRRVFMLNYGCHYEEIEGADYHGTSHTTPPDKIGRYGQYYMRITDTAGEQNLLRNSAVCSMHIKKDNYAGKILLRNVKVISREGTPSGQDIGTLLDLDGGSIECTINSVDNNGFGLPTFSLDTTPLEQEIRGGYSAYLAYATGENYPNVEISEIINAMKSMFGIRLLFNNDYSTVRIVLLRNIFRNAEVQNIVCTIVDEGEMVENCVRGFRMTYGKGKDDTSFFYKGFNDMFPRAATTWKDTTDKHDYSQWKLDADYGETKQSASAMNRTCYVTPVNGNAYIVKIDEDEDVLFPMLSECAPFIDAEDGDCSGESQTIEEVQTGASPVIMNDAGNTYASLFGGEMKAPAPQNYQYAPEVTTLGRFTKTSVQYNSRLYANLRDYRITGDLDAFIGEGFKIRMMDNYAISNGGTPFDEADPGLQFGIMRSSGEDAHINYYHDDIEDEGNDYWIEKPGSGAIDHPDTCDGYGNLFDYDGQRRITNASEAAAELYRQFPDSNAAFNHPNLGYIRSTVILYVCDNMKKEHAVMFVWQRSNPPYKVISWDDLMFFRQSLQNLSVTAMMAIDAMLRQLIVEIDTSYGRASTLTSLCGMAYGGLTNPVIIDDNGVGSLYGRLSLKLRAEKPNPYYDPTLPSVVSTKEQAGRAMKSLYRTANCDLLARPKVSNTTMRAAGWDCPGDGYATVHSMGYGVQYNNGTVHEILWSPIKPDGTVKTLEQLQDYANSFDGLPASQIVGHDTEHLILDIDTTEERADTLHKLQAIYYASPGDVVASVNIEEAERYLKIEDENLRGRGLADQFYKEYSYWIRNARIKKQPVRMELSQLRTIDKTKRVRVGDIVGFIRSLKYTVSNETGLGNVVLEIMYI